MRGFGATAPCGCGPTLGPTWSRADGPDLDRDAALRPDEAPIRTAVAASPAEKPDRR